MGTTFDPQAEAEFDAYAGEYGDLLAGSVKASGEGPEYFAEYKLRVLERLVSAPRGPILDYGCGVGNLTRLLGKAFPVVHGFDPSQKSAALAQKRAPDAKFFHDPAALPKDHYRTIVLANVLHHVPPAERASLIASIVPLLVRGGRLVVFENNPLNPLTRKAMRDCIFDENAVWLYPREVRRRLAEAGLTGRKLDYIVFFPRFLSMLRPLERRLSRVAIGAQMVAWGHRA
jgi:SAM-dependent methyltransferase